MNAFSHCRSAGWSWKSQILHVQSLLVLPVQVIPTWSCRLSPLFSSVKVYVVLWASVIDGSPSARSWTPLQWTMILYPTGWQVMQWGPSWDYLLLSVPTVTMNLHTLLWEEYDALFTVNIHQWIWADKRTSPVFLHTWSRSAISHPVILLSQDGLIPI